jgi:ATP-dependent DNA helicase RecG
MRLNMSLPEWADFQLSKDLPILRARGESQDLEYIETFPQNVRELGKEIASFASSNQGTILIGVSDIGDLVGLENAKDPAGRDELLRRIEGICSGTIGPSITPIAKFGVEDEKVVMAILVPKGSQPIYYSHYIPYVRHITQSRPAEPHEVIERIRTWIATAELKDAGKEPLSKFVSNLAQILIDVLIYTDEAEDRSINPWLDLWRTQFKYSASELRELSIQNLASEQNISTELKALAEKLDEIANFRMYMGCGPEMDALVKEANKMAQEIKIEKIDTVPISDESISDISKLIVTSFHRLQDLESRMLSMIDQGRIEEVQNEASEIGYILYKISHYNLERINPGLSANIAEVGRRLHLVETMRIYMDGGISLNKIVGEINETGKQLERIAETIS